ncbi:SusC/RagA family TonB-linked outer membrane protein [Flavivirga amylovorans]
MFSQDVKISIDSDKTLTVDEIFELIKSQTNYRFAYKSSTFLNAPKVHLKKGLINAHDLLLKSLSFSNLYYELAPNRTIVLKEKNAKIQEQSIKGIVTDSNALPLSGVTVSIEDTNKGTLTDFDGGYRIVVNAGQTLIFSYLGKKDVKIIIEEETTINVTLEDSNESLEEVVVTALGIKKNKKAAGYSVSSLKSESVEDRAEGDFTRILTGKVSGLNVTSSSGLSGSGTNVVIRGLSSFTGDNQALYIVDGVPYNNDQNQDLFGRGYLNSNETTNRAFDIDPNNIEKIEVLKGLAASTLYGSRGANGVILITTKTSTQDKANKSTVTVSQSSFINAMANIPDYQNQYGQGNNGVFNPNSSLSWGPSFEKDGPLGWGLDPNIDENGTYLHPLSGNPRFPQFQDARLPYQAVGNKNIKNFFRPGYTSITSVNFRGTSSDANTNYNASFSYLDEESFLPTNGVTRLNMNVGGSTKILERLKVTASVNFTITDQSSPNFSFDNNGFRFSNPISNTLSLPRSYDLFAQPFVDPTDNSSTFFLNSARNPRWTLANSFNEQKTNRHNWRFQLDYSLNDNLSLAWRTGRDFYSTEQEEMVNREGPVSRFDGFLRIGNIEGSIWDHLVTLNGNYKLSETIGLDFTLGGNARRDEFKSTTFRTQGQLLLNNFLITNFDRIQGSSAVFDASSFVTLRNTVQNQVGVFGDMTLSYKDYLFINGSIRSDWVSNLISGFNNATYPGVSVSFITTEAFDGLKTDNGLNYLKIRGGYGESTRFPLGYPTDESVIPGSTGGIPIQNISGPKDVSFEPEIIKEIEIGLETRFFNNRGTLDVSLWKRRIEGIQSNDDAIAPSSGAESFFTNLGLAESKGIELDLGFDILKSKHFNWNSRINFTSHEEILIRRDDEQEDFGRSVFRFGDLTSVATNAAIPNESLGAIVGTKVLRNDDGIPIVDGNGNYIRFVDEDGNSRFVLGDAIPDYRMNFINTFKYKNWNLNLLVQHVKGGDIYTPVPASLLGRGLIKDNLSAHGNTLVIDGITQSGEPNTVPISPVSYYLLNRGRDYTEFNIYDASVIRLQELSISYNFPKSFLKKTPFSGINIKAQGNNLWHSAYNIPKGTNFDPNTSGPGNGNNRGLDYSSNASARRYGITLRATF